MDGEDVGDEKGGGEEKGDVEEPKKRGVIMVRTENLKHNPFEHTQELKVNHGGAVVT